MATDYRSMFDNNWIKAWDLQGRDVTVTIEKVEAGVLENRQEQKKERMPILWFRGAKKPLALNKTNAKAVAALYGKTVEAWVGKPITIYPTTTKFGRDTVDCVRIRPTVKGNAEDMPNPAPPEREPGADDDTGGAHAAV